MSTTFMVGAATPKALGVLIGVAVMAVGLLMIATASWMTRMLNGLYGELRGRFSYPTWFIPGIGVSIVVFGVVATVGMLAFAK